MNQTAKIIVLGSASAIPDQTHDNTHLAVVGQNDLVLVDCPNNPYIRLGQAGLDPARVDHIILTHFHPDHISGLPTLLMDYWLLERKAVLHMYGLAHTLDRVKAMMALYDWDKWSGRFEVAWHYLDEQEGALLLESQDFHILSSPVDHLVPTIGLRIENKHSGQALAYSCDTQPCQQVVNLARGSQALIHEAAGALLGHTSPEQAAKIASEAGAQNLFLIHYPINHINMDKALEEAGKFFSGKITLAEDFLEIPF